MKKMTIELDVANPHRFLGLHVENGTKVIRLWRPGASLVHVEVLGHILEAEKISEAGIFEVEVPGSVGLIDYRIYHQNGLLGHDP